MAKKYLFALCAAFIFFSTLINSPLSAVEPDTLLWDFETDLAGWKQAGGDWKIVHYFLDGETINFRTPIGFHGDYFLATGEARQEDWADGVLTSPRFKITRNHLKFLLAGELHPQVRVYLLINKTEVRTAFGNNAYDLIERSWDVSEFLNQTAQFVIRDSHPNSSLLRVDYIRLSDTPAAPIWSFETPRRQESDIVRADEFKLLLDGKTINPSYATRSHSFVYDPAGKGRWHLYFTTSEIQKKWDYIPTVLHHAVADSLTGEFVYDGPVFEVDAGAGENFIREPFVLYNNGIFYLYYCGSGVTWQNWDIGTQGPYYIHLAYSTDGKNWIRKGKIIMDTPFAFSPYIHYVGGKWHMYYAGAEPHSVAGKHCILYRSSADLVAWSEPAPVLTADYPPWAEHPWLDYPLVFSRGATWYLFAGPRCNENLPRYHVLHIWAGADPTSWKIGTIPVRPAASTVDGPLEKAVYLNEPSDQFWKKRLFIDGNAKILRDTDGKWYATTSSNLGQSSGIWLAELHWNDGLDAESTSVPMPQQPYMIPVPHPDSIAVDSTAAAVFNKDRRQAIAKNSPEYLRINSSYPNPFNQETRISFTLTRPVHLKIQVYNVMGQNLAILVDQPYAQGTFESGWSAKDAFANPLPSGIYLVRFSAKEASQEEVVKFQKVVLAR